MSIAGWALRLCNHAAAAALVVSLSSGCRKEARIEQWKSFRYDASDSRTAEERIEAERALQAGVFSGGLPPRAVRGELPSNRLTEDQRRRLQQRYADEMRRRTEQQVEAAKSARQQRRSAGPRW